MTASSELIAVDVGNTRVKFGRYERAKVIADQGLPKPEQVVFSETNLQELDLWLRESPLLEGTEWVISSVKADLEKTLVHWLKENRPNDLIRKLTHDHVDLPLAIDSPKLVGFDRLCNAKAALRLKNFGEPSLVVDLGTAITLDVVSGEGTFLGGAIMPGFNASAHGLHHLTELLPLIDVEGLRLPDFPGKNTTAAIEAGLFWGAIGAIRQFLALAQEERPALLILTGGNSYQVWEALLNPYTNSKTESVICEATRVENSSGLFVPPKNVENSSLPIPDNGFIPVRSFHEVICCPYLTLSGIVLFAVSSHLDKD